MVVRLARPALRFQHFRRLQVPLHALSFRRQAFVSREHKAGDQGHQQRGYFQAPGDCLRDSEPLQALDHCV